MQKTKQFKPTEDQIRLAEAVFTAMAHEQIVRPIVEAYETAILAKHQFRIAKEWVDHSMADRVILDRKDSFLLSAEDAKVFFAECFAARDAANLKVSNPEFCPLCVAEHLRIDAENALMKAMGTTPGLETLASASMTLELRSQVIDLILKLLAPFCGDAQEILQRYR